MRIIALVTLLAATSASAAVNTQVNGLVLTNGLGSVTDSSGLGSNQSTSTGIGYLTDNDTSTFAFNIGNVGSGSLHGNFSGAISSSATGIYIIGLAANYGGGPIQSYNGPSFTVQLALLGGLSSVRTYGDADFTITSQKIQPLSYYSNRTDTGGGVVMTNIDPETEWNSAHYYTYVYIPLSDFSATYDQVVGIKLGSFTSPNPDISYIGIGYTGAPPVPEASTYGLMLGGLALAGAAIRRRKISK